ESKPKFTFRAEGSVMSPTRLPEFMGAKDFMDAYNEAYYNEGRKPFYSQELIAKHASHEDPDLYPDVNWMDLLNDHTSNQRYTLGIRGGTAKARYFVSGAYYSEKGIFKSNNLEKYDTNIGLDRFNLRSNIDLEVTKSTLLNIDLSGQYLLTNYPGQSTTAIFSSMTRTAPNQIPMVYSNGMLAGHMVNNSGNQTNPYNLLMNSGYTKEWRTAIQSKVTLNQKLNFITKGLSVRASVSFDANMLTTVKRLKTPTLYHATGRDEAGELVMKEVVTGSDNLSEGTSSSNDKQIYIEGSINYHRLFAGVHDVTGMMLYMQKEKSYYNKALPYRKQGFVGRIAYSYDSKYFIEGSFGYTGSENFAEGYRFGFFPAVGAAWFASQEAFYPERLKKVVNKLKFRLSYGRTGNDNTGGDRFIYRETLNQSGGGYNIGFTDGGTNGGVGSSIWEARFGAPYLSWEIEDKKNVGIDLGLFNNRIDLQLDYFDNKRHNILLQRQTILGIAGFQQNPWQNYGIVTNKGMDASVVLNQQLGDWKLSARGNFTFARNKIIEMDEVDPKYPWMRKTGTRLNSKALYIADGLYSAEDFNITGEGLNRIYELKDGVVKSGLTTDIRPGDIKYKDMNGDGITDVNDIVQDVGQPGVPEIVYGFGFNAEYKGFYAGIFFQGSGNTATVLGGNSPELFHPFTWGLEQSSLRNVAADRWSEDNQSQDVMYPRLRSVSFYHNMVGSTWWLRNAGFIRLKNIELGYNFKKKMLKPFRVDAMRLYLMGNNLAVWDHIKMWDPEIGNANEGLSYPLSRTFTLGLEVSF
ncbi:MAG: TonB-dependent receptor, partial [Bacteroides sp.]